MENLEPRVKKIVAEQLGVNEAEIKNESSFVDDLGADSLDTVELVMALEGTVYDVVLDIRKGSPTFGKWYGIVLSGSTLQQMYIPPGCAHGFCVTSDTACFLYKCTAYYSPKDDRGILWNDPTLEITWPVTQPILSQKDQAHRPLAAMEGELPLYTLSSE